jgi:hypothetical protein
MKLRGIVSLLLVLLFKFGYISFDQEARRYAIDIGYQFLVLCVRPRFDDKRWTMDDGRWTMDDG